MEKQRLSEEQVRQNKIIRHLTFLMDDLDRPELQDEHICEAQSLVAKSLARCLLKKHMIEHRKTIGSECNLE